MSKKSKTDANESPKSSQEPRSLAIARNGIKNSSDFQDVMSALMSDLIEGKVTPSVGNATCNAGGKLLKMVEMTYKYGSKDGQSIPKRTLIIAFEQLGGSERPEVESPK